MKHRLILVWRIIEWGNGLVFSAFFGRHLVRISNEVLELIRDEVFEFRALDDSDLLSLHEMIASQDLGDLAYFKPHRFDIKSLKAQFLKPDFLMMGAFHDSSLIGYFFLRFFANRKCFVGRIIDINYRGKGIGNVMNTIMYETAWKMEFRCLSTISRNNSKVIRAHARNSSLIILKELKDDYLLVEFVQKPVD